LGEKADFDIHNIVMIERVGRGDERDVFVKVVFSTPDRNLAENFLFAANLVNAECELQTTPVYL
jgi:hypothetical protein